MDSLSELLVTAKRLVAQIRENKPYQHDDETSGGLEWYGVTEEWLSNVMEMCSLIDGKDY